MTTEQQLWDPADVPEGFRIRQSGVKDMQMCAHHWMRYHVEGLDRLPYIERDPHKFGAMIRGSAVHAISAHCRGNGGKYSDGDVMDLLQTHWYEDEEAQRLPEDEEPNWRSASLWVMQHLQLHAYEDVKGVEVPLSTDEHPVEYKGIPVHGSIDELVATEAGLRIRDLKTGKNKVNPRNARCDVQVLMYSRAAYHNLGELIPFEIYHMPSGTDVVETPTVEDLTRFEETVLNDYVVQALYGPWPRNTQRQYGGCSYCELYDECWG